jgi:hypothetical protein
VVDPASPKPARSTRTKIELYLAMAGCAPLVGLAGLLMLVAVLLPVLAIAAGVIMEVSAANSEAAVRAYVAALPCPVAQTAADCYRLERGTIIAMRVRRGKGGTRPT